MSHLTEGMKRILKTAVTWVVGVLAREIVRKYAPTVIMVSGSVGKTSTKDALYAVLKDHTKVRRSEKSYNSETGVPLTIIGEKNPWNDYLAWSRVIMRGVSLLLRTEPYPEYLILEVGADKPGDLAAILAIAQPDIVVITRLPEIPVHVEAYASPHATREEEFSPVHSLKEGGIAVLNLDDPFVVEFAKSVPKERIAGYGTGKDAALRISTSTITHDRKGYPTGLSVKLAERGAQATVKLPGTFGFHHAYPVAAAVATARALGIPLAEAVKGFDALVPPPGRGRILPGILGSVLIDDTYNASPVAIAASLDALETLAVPGRRVLVLGDMLELGTYSIAEHQKVGERAARTADVLITVGVRARAMCDAARAAGMNDARIHCFDDSRVASAEVPALIAAGDLVLLKGSQGVRLERITRALLADTADPTRSLPRQDAEWLSR